MMDYKPESRVYVCSPTNSQLFTSCCDVAITPKEEKCPKCNNIVSGYDSNSEHRTNRMRWSMANRGKY